LRYPAEDRAVDARPVSRAPGRAVPRKAQPLHPTDPRWVLAIRAAESMQGAILPSEQRDRLIRIGRTMGLNAFEANLVIAIVQDQARRGSGPREAADLLKMVPTHGERETRRSPWLVAGLLAGLIAIEAIAIWSLFF
jgi:hypothetical protein